ncbi:carboxymuconolactone decarboxylase family protein [Xanthobacter sp. V0B-10]|uniref:carboxymuconolactone decarboxylase family protein n=1 Tax=Xanthobacter albus TaxID=3119929 RepID=UPI003727EB39
MSKDYKALIADISRYTAELRKETPDAMAGFYSLAKAASADGALDKKTKELIALAIGVTQRCDGCIGFHTKALKDLGATRAEVAEMLSMCVYMGGGPALMYAADALRAFDQFSDA